MSRTIEIKESRVRNRGFNIMTIVVISEKQSHAIKHQNIGFGIVDAEVIGLPSSRIMTTHVAEIAKQVMPMT